MAPKVKRTFFDGLDKRVCREQLQWQKTWLKPWKTSFCNAKTTVDQLREGFTRLIRRKRKV